MNPTHAGRCRLWSLAVVIIAALGGCSKEGQPAPKPVSGTPVDKQTTPNILLISVDTLRPDHLGCYGYQRETSPNIDRLATEGALFETMISSTSWTLPAHCCMFTGLADTVHGCVEMNLRLADDRVTLAEMLKGSGYQTVGFFSGPAIHPVFGVAQGFDEYIDCTSFATLSMKKIAAGEPLDGGEIERASNADVTNPRVLEEVVKFLRERRAEPFFLFVHFWDVHFDYIPPPPYDTMFDSDYQGSITSERFLSNPAINPFMDKRDLEHIIALYDGEIAWTDMHIGKLLEEIDAQGLRDETLVMFTADHGEEFFEHNRKGHRMTLYDEVIRLPLIIRYPGVVPARERCSQQARMMDILPTALDLAGLPPAKNVMGQSLRPIFAGSQPTHSDLAVSELFSVGKQLRSFRRRDRKMIYNEQTGSGSLYLLTNDPGEHRPIPDQANPITHLLISDAQEGHKWLADFRGAWPAPPTSTELPDHVRKQLESLGYIGGAERQQP